MQKNKKGATSGVVIAFVLAMVVVIAVASYSAPRIKDLATSLIGTADDQIDKAVDNTPKGEVPTPDLPDVSSTTISTSSTGEIQGSGIAEKAVTAAKEAGMDREGAELILKLISQESNFRHCCKENTRPNGRCTVTDEVECPAERTLISFDGSSTGAMQLNKNVHKPWFVADSTELCKNTSYAGVCKIKESVGCTGKTGYNLDCNLRMGIGLLQSYKNQYGSGKLFKCTGRTYTGWDAALRGYVGYGCQESMLGYVEELKKKDISKYKSLLDQAYS